MSYAIPGTSRTSHEDRSNRVHLSSNHHKVVVLGSTYSGKTAIVQQFLYDYFIADYIPTVDELHRVDFEVDSTLLTLDILDSAGNNEFPAMQELAIRTSEAFIIVFSVTSMDTFIEAKRLRDLVMTLKNNKAAIVVVGNKVDLDERQVTTEFADTSISLDWEHTYIETSAKINSDVVSIFMELFKEAHIEYRLKDALEKRRRSLPCFLHQRRLRLVRPFKRHSCTIS